MLEQDLAGPLWEAFVRNDSDEWGLAWRVLPVSEYHPDRLTHYVLWQDGTLQRCSYKFVDWHLDCPPHGIQTLLRVNRMSIYQRYSRS